MNRDESIALFERCEAARAEARAAGKDKDAAHEAAKAVWNAWAEKMLADRKLWEKNGWWAARRDWKGDLEPEDDATRAWMKAAAVDFSRLRFVTALVQKCGPQAGEDLESDETANAIVKSIAVESDAISFDGFVFPGDAGFEEARFCGNTEFAGARFNGGAWFRGALFSGAWFAGAEFNGAAWFTNARFSGGAWFRGARFSGAWFKGAEFSGDAGFTDARFGGGAQFDRAQFRSEAQFSRAEFSDYAWFNGAEFSGGTWFTDVRFSGDALFQDARFGGAAWFRDARFCANAEFTITQFSGEAGFRGVEFSGNALFQDARFSGDALLADARFSGDALFPGVRFGGDALFGGAGFVKNAFFDNVKFCGDADFFLAKFEHFASFENARFCRGADFGAIRGERAFSLAKAEFDGVPDFIQAHFEEAPRLDNIRVHARMIDPPPEDAPKPGKKKPEPSEDAPEVPGLPATDGNAAPSGRWARLRNARIARAAKGVGRRVTAAKSSLARRTRAALVAAKSGFARRRTWPARAAKGVWRRITNADGAIPARFRALKRIAIQGHDADREHEFFGREIRSDWFADDWPLPWPFWKLKGWAGFARFWWGLGYQVFGGLGTSFILPLFWWGLMLCAAATLYLGENPEMIRERQILRHCEGASWYSAYAQSTYEAWRQPRACYAPPPPADVNVTHVGALSASVRAGTDAPTEALHLAFRNAFIVLDGGADAAHRTYGCLYGVELFGGSNPVTVVPNWVSTVSAAQKLVSALFIFLFGLAVRNMLKMK